MFKSKTVLIFTIILLALVAILFVFLRLIPAPPKQSLPVPGISITPPLTPYLTPKQIFLIKSTNLSDQVLQTGQIIKIDFNQNIALKNIQLQLTPNEEINLSIDPMGQSLLISPKNTWGIDTSYSLKILKTTTSVNNQFLDKQYEYQFKTPPYTGI